MSDPFIIFVIFLFIGGFLLYAYVHAKQRTEALQQTALSLSLSFKNQASSTRIRSLEHFNLFSRGRSKKMHNILEGTFNDTPITLFDYRYSTGGKNSSTYQQTAVLLTLPTTLPLFLLRPEHIGDKIGSAFGRQDINFDTFPTFSKHYFLRGESELTVRQQFNDIVINHFEQNLGIHLQSDGQHLLYYRFRKIVPPEEIFTFIQEARHIYAMLT